MRAMTKLKTAAMSTQHWHQECVAHATAPPPVSARRGETEHQPSHAGWLRTIPEGQCPISRDRFKVCRRSLSPGDPGRNFSPSSVPWPREPSPGSRGLFFGNKRVKCALPDDPQAGGLHQCAPPLHVATVNCCLRRVTAAFAGSRAIPPRADRISTRGTCCQGGDGHFQASPLRRAGRPQRRPHRHAPGRNMPAPG